MKTKRILLTLSLLMGLVALSCRSTSDSSNLVMCACGVEKGAEGCCDPDADPCGCGDTGAEACRCE